MNDVEFRAWRAGIEARLDALEAPKAPKRAPVPLDPATEKVAHLLGAVEVKTERVVRDRPGSEQETA